MAANAPRSAPHQDPDTTNSVPGMSNMFALHAAVVVVAALYFARDVLVPIMLAVLLAFILAPLVVLLRKLRFGRTPSVIIAVLMALAVFGMIGTVVGVQVAHLGANAPRYAEAIQKKMNAARSTTIEKLQHNLGKISQRFEQPPRPTPAREGLSHEAATRSTPIPVEVHEPAPSSVQTIQNILYPVVGPLETTIIVLIVAIFVLLQRDDLRDRLIRLFGSSDLHRTTVALDDAGARLSRYFLTQLVINASFGFAIGVGLYFIGIPSPALWGILAGLLRFVPYIGAFLAAVPPLVLGAAVDPGWTMVIATGLMFVIAEPIMGYVVEPMIYGHSTGLSPVAVIVAAIFWTWLWGPIGLILSTPLTLCMVVLGRHVKRLEFIDVMLGDRPALTPVESFYQRMLAGDVEELVEQAETLLKERSLSSYYDEVAVPGLRLAVVDRRRGVLSGARLAELAESTRALMEELSDHDDRDPLPNEDDGLVTPLTASPNSAAQPHNNAPAGRTSDIGVDPRLVEEAAVLCVPGPGPINDVVAAMLTQLLRKHGVGAIVSQWTGAPNEEPSARPAFVLLVYADIARGRRGLTALVQQTRNRLPGTHIASGLWRTSGRPSLSGRGHESSDHGHFSTLSEAVSLCLSPTQEK